MTWSALFDIWALVCCDLHEFYGIDTESSKMRRRSWRWLRHRIIGLLACESRTYRHFNPPEKQKQPRMPRRR